MEVDRCDYFDPTKEGVLSLKSLKSDDSWDEPDFFTANDRPDIPAELLPGIFDDFSKSLAVATEVPEGLAVFGVLGAISAAISHRFVVSPISGWEEPLNLYLLAALPPGNNKSSVLRACSDPLTHWEKEQAEKLGPEIKRAISERKTMEKLIDKERSDAIKEKDHDRRKHAFHEIADMEATLEKIPALPQVFVTDATPESLVISTYEQGGRFAIIGDEGGILEVISGLYSGGQANINIVLNGIDGGHVRVRRKDNSIDINPYLTFCLFVQPVIVQSMSKKRAFAGKGMLERFLYFLPQSNLGYRTHDTEPVKESIKKAYNDKVTGLLNKFMLVGDQNNERIVITLDNDSLNAWREFQGQIEKELRANGRLSQVTGWGGKISGFTLRLAGLLHVMKHNGDSLRIDIETMNNALKIAEILIDHALGAFGLMAIDKVTAKAHRALDWIRANGESTFKRRACHRGLIGQFENVKELEMALALLKENNIISGPLEVKDNKMGRPSIFYKVNPALFSEVN